MDYARMTDQEWSEHHDRRFAELIAARDAAVAELKALQAESLRRQEAENARLRAELAAREK